MTPVDESIQVNGGALGHDDAVSSSIHVSTNYVEGMLQVSGDRPKHYHDFDDSYDEADSDAGSVTMTPVDESIQVIGDPPSCENAEANTVNQTILSVNESIQSDGIHHKIAIPPGISKITELTLDQFENNYKLFAKKLVDVETDLVIRAIFLKNYEVIFNYSFKIISTDNVQNATIAAATKVCDLFLG